MHSIILITGEDDPHVPAVGRYIETTTRLTVLTLEDFLRSGFVFSPTRRNGSHSLKLTTTDRVFDEQNVHSARVWLLFPNVFFYHSGTREPHENEYHRMEVTAFFDGVYELFNCAWWLNSPAAIRASENRLRQLTIASKVGFRVPKTIVTNRQDVARRFWRASGGRLVIKRLGNRRVYLPPGYEIMTSRLLEEDLGSDDFKRGLNLLQEEVGAEFEVRVTVVGNDVYSAEWRRKFEDDSIIDWRANPTEPLLGHHDLPRPVIKKILSLTNSYQLNFATVDLLFNPPSSYTFLEINSNGQYLWIEEALDLPISRAIAQILVR